MGQHCRRPEPWPWRRRGWPGRRGALPAPPQRGRLPAWLPDCNCRLAALLFRPPPAPSTPACRAQQPPAAGSMADPAAAAVAAAANTELNDLVRQTHHLVSRAPAPGRCGGRAPRGSSAAAERSAARPELPGAATRPRLRRGPRNRCRSVPRLFAAAPAGGGSAAGAGHPDRSGACTHPWGAMQPHAQALQPAQAGPGRG